MGATPADHLGQSHDLQVVDCSVHHLAGHGANVSNDGTLQLFGCPWLVSIDPIYEIAPKEEVERTLSPVPHRPLRAIHDGPLHLSDGLHGGLPLPCFLWNILPSLNSFTHLLLVALFGARRVFLCTLGLLPG